MKTIFVPALWAILCAAPLAAGAAGEVSPAGPSGQGIAAIEKLYFKHEIRPADLPRLEKSGRKDETTMEGVPCRAEWFVVAQEGYIISRTGCVDRTLSYVIFKITEKQEQKINMVFYAAFYDSDGDGVFERIHDMKDRPLPQWVKERHEAWKKEEVERHLAAVRNGAQLPPVYSYARLAQDRLEARDYDAVISLVEKAVALKYEHHIFHEFRGFALVEKKRYEEAISDANRALELEPVCFTPYLVRGESQLRLGRYEQAIADLTRAVELRPDLVEAFRSRGEAFSLAGRKQEALEDFARAIELRPDDCCAYLKRGAAHMEHGDYEQALADFDKALQTQPETAYMNRGVALYRMGRYEAAVADFGKSLEILAENDYSRLYLLIAAQRISGERLRRGAKEQKAHDRAAPSTEWSRMLLRYFMGSAGLTEERLLTEANKAPNERRKRERLCEAYYVIGEKRLVKGDTKGAAEYFSKSVETDVRDFLEYGTAKAVMKALQKESSR